MVTLNGDRFSHRRRRHHYHHHHHQQQQQQQQHVPGTNGWVFQIADSFHKPSTHCTVLVLNSVLETANYSVDVWPYTTAVRAGKTCIAV